MVGTLTQSDREAAEVTNQHFFRTLTKEDTTNIPHGTPKNLTTETPTTFDITEELLKKCLLQLKTDKSPGTNAITPRILKDMSEQRLNITIFQSSNTTETLERCNYLPKYKKKSKKNAANYRSVHVPDIITLSNGA